MVKFYVYILKTYYFLILEGVQIWWLKKNLYSIALTTIWLIIIIIVLFLFSFLWNPLKKLSNFILGKLNKNNLNYDHLFLNNFTFRLFENKFKCMDVTTFLPKIPA